MLLALDLLSQLITKQSLFPLEYLSVSVKAKHVTLTQSVVYVY